MQGGDMSREDCIYNLKSRFWLQDAGIKCEGSEI